MCAHDARQDRLDGVSVRTAAAAAPRGVDMFVGRGKKHKAQGTTAPTLSSGAPARPGLAWGLAGEGGEPRVVGGAASSRVPPLARARSRQGGAFCALAPHAQLPTKLLSGPAPPGRANVASGVLTRRRLPPRAQA